VNAPNNGTFARAFVSKLASIQLENVFNPYSERCTRFDVKRAPAIRRTNLERVLLAALRSGARSIWIGRDLGHRGGRRTGLALTDECHLNEHAMAFEAGTLNRATVGPQVAERTATMIWEVLRQLDHPVFLWNVFPLHPHMKDDPLSNRCHTRREREPFASMLLELIDALSPDRVIALGNDAAIALDILGVSATTLRHPSYGGQRQFKAEAARLYRVALS
jgi:hypothetical protein